MAATPYAAKLAAYSSAQAHGGVAAGAPSWTILVINRPYPIKHFMSTMHNEF